MHRIIYFTTYYCVPRINNTMMGRLDSCNTKCLCKIMGYTPGWIKCPARDYFANLSRSQLTALLENVSIQLQYYGHCARFPWLTRNVIAYRTGREEGHTNCS